MVYKRYIKKNSGRLCGFYIYHSFREYGRILTIYLGKESDSSEDIERICNLIAQGFYDCYNLSEKDVEKYLVCYMINKSKSGGQNGK